MSRSLQGQIQLNQGLGPIFDAPTSSHLLLDFDWGPDGGGGGGEEGGGPGGGG